MEMQPVAVRNAFLSEVDTSINTSLVVCVFKVMPAIDSDKIWSDAFGNKYRIFCWSKPCLSTT